MNKRCVFKQMKKLNKQIMKLLMRIYTVMQCIYRIHVLTILMHVRWMGYMINCGSIQTAIQSYKNMIYFRETWLVIHVIHMYYNIQSSSLSGEFILDPSLNCQADLCKIRKLLEKNYIRRFKDSNIRWILPYCMHVYTLKYSAVINSSDISN